MLNYSELSELLRQSGSVARAADCHGFLCGHLCVADLPERDIWEEYLDLQTDNDKIAINCLDQIDRLLADTRRLLDSPELDFQPMLPDDDSPLPARVIALGEWCNGFLNGFALGQQSGAIMANEDGKELIESFTRICQVDAKDVGDESDEQALFELIEYVRMGTIFLFDQLQLLNPGDKGEIYH
jgi:uncharacterized protein YgfB (UPF0149 family)